ncbi:MAG: hypothetical protein LBH51_00530 [Treponema sp.]|jgi:hypothetical protein|nr:hypothetical protein [Treponema sp.]
MSDREFDSDGAGMKARTGDGKSGFVEAAAELNILGHLLKIEADASAMADDAMAEADRRIAESEKRNRIRYDEEYSRQAAELDRVFEEGVARIHADYRAQLEAYQESLNSISVDQKRFAALVEKFLTGGNEDPGPLEESRG